MSQHTNVPPGAMNTHLTRQKQYDSSDVQNSELRRWYSDNCRWAVILEDCEFTDNMTFVPNIYQEFASTSVEALAASCDGAADIEVRGAVQTFFESPVVRAAFGAFKAQCSSADIMESDIVGILAISATDYDLFKAKGAFVPAIWAAAEPDRGHRHASLRKLVNEYMLRVESWRLKGLSNGRPWGFGTPDSMLKFLKSTLVQLWHMDQQGSFNSRKVQTNSKDWNVLWDEWVKKCNKADAENSIAKSEAAYKAGTGKVEDAVVYIGAGRCLAGWLERA
ncbi:hypothetical protein NQ176_g2409 [Zarea fungicola]|uniref:Uncharacterized protein n=1 Tax=Zarea fungicola TaxID=93591 RepID=A0ACC1NQN7_9HYPO|nr:hypothetical protein NQ176_g2409 [Lecanicillium fungicola]